MKERYGDIVARAEGAVAIVELNRPPHNHVTVQLMRDLADALDDIDGDRGLRCTVLRAAGKSFCAGADFAAPPAARELANEGINALYEEAVRLFSAEKPIVAAVQGAAIGAGLGLALVADFRIAAPEARFSANFVKLGFHPGFGISLTLPRLIGVQKATLMCLTGRRIKPDEALAWGLVDQVVPAVELTKTAIALAAEIAENAPLAVQATRASLREGLAAAVKAQTDKEFIEQAALRKTADFAEGIRAVRERRPGNFIGA
ncbi:MAG: enoyl-CoA hydratase/isomerase family protein [Alphaproteobacteria bacterium]|nr:enoyl-CoA hydratase/isomerase family protein [Alphaproteobacteria bacterium]